MYTQVARDKLKTVPGFADTDRSNDFIKLIVAIRGITLKFESNKDLSTPLTCSLARVLKCRQGPTESLIKRKQ